MQTIPSPRTNLDDPDVVLAQTVAGHAGWLFDDACHVYDSHGIAIAESLFALVPPMRLLEWFTPVGSMASGVNWAAMPPVDEQAAHVRSALRTLAKREHRRSTTATK